MASQRLRVTTWHLHWDFQKFPSAYGIFLSPGAILMTACGGITSRQPLPAPAQLVNSPQTLPKELRWHVLMLNERGRLFGFQQLTIESTIESLDKDFDLESGVPSSKDPVFLGNAQEYIEALIEHAQTLSTKEWETQ